MISFSLKEGEQKVISNLNMQDIITLFNTSPHNSLVVTGGPNSTLYVRLFSLSGIKVMPHSSSLILIADEGGVQGEYLITKHIEDMPNEEGKKLVGKKFYLDAGHGGSDPGAVNNNLAFEEKVAALDICLKLGLLLERMGANVKYSRTIDTYPSLTQRAREANNFKADAFISIHLNSAENKSASGIETLVYANTGITGKLASVVQSNMVKATSFKDRGVKVRPDLTVLKKTSMPAILCEVGFISNDDEARLLFSKKIQDGLAKAIADGVAEVF